MFDISYPWLLWIGVGPLSCFAIGLGAYRWAARGTAPQALRIISDSVAAGMSLKEALPLWLGQSSLRPMGV